jgi:hypothetical protein
MVGTSGQEVKGDRNFRQKLLDRKLSVTGSLGRKILHRNLKTVTLGQAHRTGIWDRDFTIGTTGILLQVYYRNFRTGTLNDKNVKQQFEDRTLIKKPKGGSWKKRKFRTGT